MGELVKIIKKDRKSMQKRGEIIAEAFLNEEGSYPGIFTKRELSAYFSCVVELGIRAKGFYAYMEDNEEKGYLIYWKKSKAASYLLKLWISYKILMNISSQKIARFNEPLKDWKDYEETYKKEKEYLDLFLVCVPIPYQHTHVFRNMLSIPLEQAREEGIVCILETDSELKMKKYSTLGLKVVSSAVLSNGVKKYIMEYR